MDAKELRSILKDISYKPGWMIITGGSFNHGTAYLQVSCEVGVDSTTGDPSPWKGRKQRLSDWMCRQEIVGLCFAMIRDAEEHEMREWYRYKGASIYNPHLDPEALVEVAQKRSSFNVREDSMVKA